MWDPGLSPGTEKKGLLWKIAGLTKVSSLIYSIVPMLITFDNYSMIR